MSKNKICSAMQSKMGSLRQIHTKYCINLASEVFRHTGLNSVDPDKISQYSKMQAGIFFFYSFGTYVKELNIISVSFKLVIRNRLGLSIWLAK